MELTLESFESYVDSVDQDTLTQLLAVIKLAQEKRARIARKVASVDSLFDSLEPLAVEIANSKGLTVEELGQTDVTDWEGVK